MEQKPKSSKRSLIRKSLQLLNYFCVLLLFLCYLVPYVSPVKFGVLAFFGLAYPVLLLVNFIFFLFWLINGKWQFLVSFVIILLGFSQLRTHIQVHVSDMADPAVPQLKVLSYNVRLFDAYNWTHNRETRMKMLNYLKKAHADLYCFQEYFQQDKHRFSVTDSLDKMIHKGYHDTDYFLTINNTNHFGLAIFSRYPIINTGKVGTSNSRSDYAIFADVLWNHKIIRVYNTHLESIHFGLEDYSFYSEFSQNPIENKAVTTGTMRISRKLYKAFSLRAVQAEEISAHIRRSPYPVIVCGDFNDTPCSYTYQQMGKGLKDAFVESGLGLGKTYTGIFPSFRIDYILYSKYFQAFEYKTDRVKYSDHYPISSVLSPRPEKQ